MGGIAEEHVEWAVINRLEAMLSVPPATEFNVTLAFSLFSSILLWSKNRMWVPNSVLPADNHAAAARAALGQKVILSEPWSLSLSAPDDHDGMAVNADFAEMSADAFFKWLRDALAHGDGRSIKPIHWRSQETGKEWLGGFIIAFKETRTSDKVLTLHLFKRDIQNLGQQLADLFCQHLAQDGDYRFSDNATKHLSEITQ